jgi:alpha-glucosidase
MKIRPSALLLTTVVTALFTTSNCALTQAADKETKPPAPAAPSNRPLPDDGKTVATITEVPVKKIDPPEKDFYAKRLDYRGLPIKGAAVVSDAAFYEAWRRVDNLLRHNPVILQNLLRAGSEVHIIGKDQAQTDLPEFRRQKGVPLRENPRITLDERARGMGGRVCSCGEENLLKLPHDRYHGRDILSHEFTHTIHGYGVSQNIRELVTKTYRAARDKKLWEMPDGKPVYAGTNENEYLAELALWYVGGHGDWPSGMPPMEPGPEFIKKYDPDGYKLVDDLFSGRLDVKPVSPRPRRGRQ